MNPSLALLLLAVIPVCAGCVRRTVTIVTEPPGALVWMNDREVGRTPLDVEFVQYGNYEVRLERDGYEPVTTSGRAVAPWWDAAGPDFIAELLPLTLHSRTRWTYELEPLRDDRDNLIQRADRMRTTLGRDADEAGNSDR